MSDSNTYQVNCDCSNCGNTGLVGFPKGETVEVCLRTTPCPICGCMRLKQHKEPVELNPWKRYHPWYKEPFLPAIPMNVSPEVNFPGKPSTVFCSASLSHEINCDLHDMS